MHICRSAGCGDARRHFAELTFGASNKDNLGTRGRGGQCGSASQTSTRTSNEHPSPCERLGRTQRQTERTAHVLVRV